MALTNVLWALLRRDVPRREPEECSESPRATDCGNAEPRHSASGVSCLNTRLSFDP